MNLHLTPKLYTDLHLSPMHKLPKERYCSFNFLLLAMLFDVSYILITFCIVLRAHLFLGSILNEF